MTGVTSAVAAAKDKPATKLRTLVEIDCPDGTRYLAAEPLRWSNVQYHAGLLDEGRLAAQLDDVGRGGLGVKDVTLTIEDADGTLVRKGPSYFERATVRVKKVFIDVASDALRSLTFTAEGAEGRAGKLVLKATDEWGLVQKRLFPSLTLTRSLFNRIPQDIDLTDKAIPVVYGRVRLPITPIDFSDSDFPRFLVGVDSLSVSKVYQFWNGDFQAVRAFTTSVTVQNSVPFTVVTVSGFVYDAQGQIVEHWADASRLQMTSPGSAFVDMLTNSWYGLQVSASRLQSGTIIAANSVYGTVAGTLVFDSFSTPESRFLGDHVPDFGGNWGGGLIQFTRWHVHDGKLYKTSLRAPINTVAEIVLDTTPGSHVVFSMNVSSADEGDALIGITWGETDGVDDLSWGISSGQLSIVRDMNAVQSVVAQASWAWQSGDLFTATAEPTGKYRILVNSVERVTFTDADSPSQLAQSTFIHQKIHIGGNIFFDAGSSAPAVFDSFKIEDKARSLQFDAALLTPMTGDQLIEQFQLSTASRVRARQEIEIVPLSTPTLVYSFTPSNVKRGSVSYRDDRLGRRVNVARLTYLPAQSGKDRRTVTYTHSNTGGLGVRRELRLETKLLGTHFAAQWAAQLHVNILANPRHVRFKAAVGAAHLDEGDWVTITHSHYGWDAALALIENVTATADGEVQVEARLVNSQDLTVGDIAGEVIGPSAVPTQSLLTTANSTVGEAYVGTTNIASNAVTSQQRTALGEQLLGPLPQILTVSTSEYTVLGTVTHNTGRTVLVTFATSISDTAQRGRVVPYAETMTDSQFDVAVRNNTGSKVNSGWTVTVWWW